MSDAARVVQTEDGPGTVDADGNLRIETANGGLIIRHDWGRKSEDAGSSPFNENLAGKMTPQQRSMLASDLLRGIRADELTRADYLQSLADAVDMLGVRMKKPGAGSDDSAAPVEGMSTFDHPLLFQACIRFQADALAEMLPADGPVKVRDDETEPPEGRSHATADGSDGSNGGPPLQDAAPVQETSWDLAAALEKRMNHYLTTVATEYYPDSRRSFFQVGLKGTGFKKVFKCPLRRRPVSEAIAPDDLICDHAATDLQNAALVGRVTHRIKMQKSMIRRMVKAGFYRECDLGVPTPDMSVVEQAEARAEGKTEYSQDTELTPHTIYECSTGLDPMDVADPANDDGGVYLPYKVIMEKTSQEILGVYRNWDEDDDLRLPRDEYVKYAYVDGDGFYAWGLIHILGNTVKALTAAFRLMLDAGMFANFPGFLYADVLGRQVTNQFRVPPGGGVPIQTGGRPIGDMIKDMPYRDIGQAFLAFIQHVEEYGRQLGGEVAAPLMEGRANMPVGTMLAAIEQAVKPIKGVFKGLHESQAKELRLFRERFREDPEALWRFDKKNRATPWEQQQLIQALNDMDLVPASDPNTISQVQRIAIAGAVFQAALQVPAAFQEIPTLRKLLRMINWPDIDGTLKTQDQFDQAQAANAQAMQKGGGAGSDPALSAAKVAESQAKTQLAQAQTAKTGAEAQQAGGQIANDAADRQQKAASDLIEAQQRQADREKDLQIAQLKEHTERVKTGAQLVHSAIEGHATAAGDEAQRAHERGMAVHQVETAHLTRPQPMPGQQTPVGQTPGLGGTA